MRGTKRTHSVAFPEERASKLVKSKSSIRVSEKLIGKKHSTQIQIQT